MQSKRLDQVCFAARVNVSGECLFTVFSLKSLGLVGYLFISERNFLEKGAVPFCVRPILFLSLEDKRTNLFRRILFMSLEDKRTNLFRRIFFMSYDVIPEIIYSSAG